MVTKKKTLAQEVVELKERVDQGWKSASPESLQSLAGWMRERVADALGVPDNYTVECVRRMAKTGALQDEIAELYQRVGGVPGTPGPETPTLCFRVSTLESEFQGLPKDHPRRDLLLLMNIIVNASLIMLLGCAVYFHWALPPKAAAPVAALGANARPEINPANPPISIECSACAALPSQDTFTGHDGGSADLSPALTSRHFVDVVITNTGERKCWTQITPKDSKPEVVWLAASEALRLPPLTPRPVEVRDGCPGALTYSVPDKLLHATDKVHVVELQ